MFYIFLQIYLTSLRGKGYFAKEPEPGVLGPLEPEPLEKKIPGAGAAWEKNQDPEPLEKSQEPEL